MSSIRVSGFNTGNTALFDQADNPLYHKDLIYDGNDFLIRVDVYEDAALTIKLYQKDLVYDVNDRLETLTVTRIGDGDTATKTLNYELDDKLDDIIIS